MAGVKLVHGIAHTTVHKSRRVGRHVVLVALCAELVDDHARLIQPAVHRCEQVELPPRNEGMALSIAYVCMCMCLYMYVYMYMYMYM